MSQRIPLIVGVTGHRCLCEQDLPALRQQVRRVFVELHARYPQTPFVLLSPLAAGADRLVAKLVLELAADKNFQAEIQLVVPLPWPRDVCEALVHRTGEREEFDRLLDQAAQVIEIPLADGVNAEEISHNQKSRATQYQEVGRYISRHSQILIALWDGVCEPAGGTARVIQWQHQGVIAPFAASNKALDETECGPVYHITTPRDEPGANRFTVELKNLYPDERRNDKENEEYYHNMWSWFDRFNADISSTSKTFTTQVATSKSWVIPEDGQPKLYENHLGLLNLYASADAAALKYQTRNNRVLCGLFLLVGVAVICFELYTHLLTNTWGLLVAYIGLLMLGGVVYRVAHRQKCHDKFVDYRAIAEALRVQFFWRLAGLPHTVSDHYLRTMRSELDWIRQAVRSCQLITHAHSRAERQFAKEHQTQSFELIQKHWVQDQLNYFVKSAGKKQKTAHRWELAIKLLYSTATMLAVVMLFVHWKTHHMNHILAVLVFIAAAGTAMLNDFSEKSAFAVLARRYEWMRSLFTTANKRLVDFIESNNYDQAAELVQLLGEDALIENADWVIQSRDRQPEVPPPG